MGAKCSTIVLIHDLWITPLAWEPFQKFYRNLGYEVLAPAWPGLERGIAELRRDPSALNAIGAREVADHYAKIVRGLSESPVIIGHGYGGLITQLLVDRGLGAAGVVIATIPPMGIPVRSLSTGLILLRALSTAFKFHGTCSLNFSQFRRWFGNTLPESEAHRAYDVHTIPASRRAIFQAVLANVTPGAATTINFKNANRPPLLMISGTEDRISSAALSRRLAHKHRGSPCRSDYKEFPGRSHYIIAEQGWQEVADYALTWALAQARVGG